MFDHSILVLINSYCFFGLDLCKQKFYLVKIYDKVYNYFFCIYIYINICICKYIYIIHQCDDWYRFNLLSSIHRNIGNVCNVTEILFNIFKMTLFQSIACPFFQYMFVKIYEKVSEQPRRELCGAVGRVLDIFKL